MRILEKTTFMLSSDDVADPQNILLKSVKETADITSCTKAIVGESVFALSTTHTIDFGDIAAAKFLYIKPALDMTAIIEGQSIDFRAGKESFLWADFTSLQFVVGLVANKISFAVGGV